MNAKVPQVLCLPHKKNQYLIKDKRDSKISKHVYQLGKQFIIVWLRYMLLNTNAVHSVTFFHQRAVFPDGTKTHVSYSIVIL